MEPGCCKPVFTAVWHPHCHSLGAAFQVFDNVVVQPRDAREASDVFYRQRIGDVLLTYENEVVLTNQVGGRGVQARRAHAQLLGRRA